MSIIKSYKFNKEGIDKSQKSEMSSNWPVVYLISNNASVYIGETSSFNRRAYQHLNDIRWDNFEKINVIYDKEFNKSSILDIEQNLIRLFSTDQKLIVENGNQGQSQNHNYYQREKYHNKLPAIWEELRKQNLADKNYLSLFNSELYTYSPYISLTSEQFEVAFEILRQTIDALNNNINLTSIVNGGAGTGKTILAINIIFNFINSRLDYIDYKDLSIDDLTFEEKVIRKIMDYNNDHGGIKIAFVVPMSSLRKTIGKVFRANRNSLNNLKVVGPNDITKDNYDVIMVDESHRLSKRKNIVNYKSFDDASKLLGLDPLNASQLDWIVKQSKTRILFYDENQTIKPADISKEELYNSLEDTNISTYNLTTQMRSKGGQTFERYTKNILNGVTTKKHNDFIDFEVFQFDKFNDLFDLIKNKNTTYGLSRVAAGYSWPWKSKKFNTRQAIIEYQAEDIEIQGIKYIWNMSNSEFTLDPNSVNEVGSIHTTQGYDLNYVGVVFGREIDYDFEKEEITINKDLFFDINVKKNATDEDLKKYIINSYHTMIMRGIRGCYIFAYNKNLQKYLSNYFDKYKKDEYKNE